MCPLARGARAAQGASHRRASRPPPLTAIRRSSDEQGRTLQPVALVDERRRAGPAAAKVGAVAGDRGPVLLRGKRSSARRPAGPLLAGDSSGPRSLLVLTAFVAAQ